MEKEIRLSFFKRIKMSIFDFDKYHVIASEGLGRSMMYLVKLVLLFSLIMSFATVIKFSQIINGVTSYVQNETPNFYFKDNQFTVESENDITIENHEYLDLKIILSNSEEYSENEIKDFDGVVIVLLKNNVLFKTQNSTSIMVQSYEEMSKMLDINQLNKEKALSYLQGENMYTILANTFAVIFITAFLTYFMTAILDSLALFLLGFIISRIIRLPLKYGPIYSIAISSITLPMVINLIYLIVNMYTGFIIPYFQIMYTLLSYVYLIASLLIMKSEILKKKVKVEVTIMNKKKEENKEENENQQGKDDDGENKKVGKDDENSNEPKNENSEGLKNNAQGKINNKDNPEPQANIREE